MKKLSESNFVPNIKTKKMEQPELGIKICDLRALKGITQKELADACNMDIRTIQRIESGEVTPRMFTLKQIAEVLNCKFEEFNGKIGSVEPTGIVPVKLAFIFGILFITNNIPYNLFDGFLQTSHNPVLFYVWLGLSLVHLVTVLFFFWGLYHVSKTHQASLLKIASIMSMVTVPVLVFSSIGFNYLYTPVFYQIRFVSVVLCGISAILLGLGLLRLHIRNKTLAEIAGILQLIIGPLFLVPVSVFQIIGLILTFPANILILIIFYQEWKQVNR